MKNGNFVKLYDTVRISPVALDQIGSDLRDSFVHPGNNKLRVSIVATHSGRVTRNHGFYLPQKMRDGAASLLEEFGKPILLHHNESRDPVGRVVGARYVDTSDNFVRDSYNDGVIRSITDFKTPYYRQVSLADELINSELASDPAYNGLGYILVEAEISDSEAIKKILDKRYLTVSIGATTDKAICSVCKQNWVEEGRCEHTPGKIYEDKLCVMIAGKLFYDEVSFVNAPADVKAQVIAIQSGGVADSVMAEEAKDAHEVNARFSFSLQDKVGGKEMNAKEAWEKVQALLQDSEKEEEVLTALTDFLATDFEGENPHKDEAEKMLKDLKPSDQEPEPAAAEELEDEVNTEEPAEEPVKDDNTSPLNADELTAEQWEDADKHYEAMIAFGYELSLVDEKLEDAKLSPEKRKTLKKSTFCKPGDRKYPVPNSEHVSVAMAYAKKNDEASSVLECIRRKASALGCSDTLETTLDTILEDYAKRTDTSEPTEEPTTEVSVEDNVETAAVCEECTVLKEQLKALRGELRDIYNEAAEDEQMYVDALNKAREVIAKTVAKLELVSGSEIADFEQHTTETAAMKIEDLFSKAGEVADSVDTEKILDKLNDGMSREPTEVIEDPTITDQAQEDPTGEEQTNREEEDKVSRIKDGYQYLLDSKGLEEADAYIKNLKRDGVIDSDFDPNS